MRRYPFASFLCMAAIMCVFDGATAKDTNYEAATKDGSYVCKSKDLITKAASAIRSRDAGKTKIYFDSGDCRQLKPNIKVLVIQEGEWGQPIEIMIDGNRWWAMQHMLVYSEAKENENNIAKLYFAGGVWTHCKWQSTNVMVKKLMRIGDWAIQQYRISEDRVYELQKMHLREGKEFAIKNGCDDPVVQRIKIDYDKYFAGQ
jgi:hypothetical protein